MRLKHIIRLSMILVCFNVSTLASGAELSGVRQELNKVVLRNRISAGRLEFLILVILVGLNTHPKAAT